MSAHTQTRVRRLRLPITSDAKSPSCGRKSQDFIQREMRTTNEAVQKALQAEMALLDASAEKLIVKHSDLAAKVKAFSAVKGVGTRTAMTVLAEMPEIGSVNRRQAASLAGLAPYDRESGTSEGCRHIFGGRKKLRTALYMASVSASRFNAVLSRFFRRLRKQGKPAMVAILAVARKLLVHLNSMARKLNCDRREKISGHKPTGAINGASPSW
jgi:transposase